MMAAMSVVMMLVAPLLAQTVAEKGMREAGHPPTYYGR